MRTRGLIQFVVWTPLTILLLLLIGPYACYTAYDDRPMEPFQGNHWYNPYARVDGGKFRANFHAHSRAWGGLTWGEQEAGEVIAAYAARGYDAPALSNYHRITGPEHYPDSLIHIPTYEHGFNTRKVHCLCIGARAVSFLDYPWHFSPNHTRETIRRLKKNCDLVALAHPGARRAHTPEEMALFPQLDLMEVGNTMGVRTAYWDAALSQGIPVWLLANDDTHDLAGEEIFVRWNMILSGAAHPDSLIASLRRGSHYGVYSYDRLCEDNSLTEVGIFQDTLRIALRDTFNRLDIYGQGGALVATIANTDRINYTVQPSDTYLRAEIHHDHCVMYLNPMMRFDGNTPPHLLRTDLPVDIFNTWAGRIAAIFIMITIAGLWIRGVILNRKKR